jgi:hypothetical protein
VGHNWQAVYLVSDKNVLRCAFIMNHSACPCTRCGEITPSKFLETPGVMIAVPAHMSDWMGYKMVRWADDVARQAGG